MAYDNFLVDKRVVERNIKKGLVDPEALRQQIDGLPDRESNCVHVSLEGGAQSASSDDGDVVRAAEPEREREREPLSASSDDEDEDDEDDDDDEDEDDEDDEDEDDEDDEDDDDEEGDAEDDEEKPESGEPGPQGSGGFEG